MFQRIGLFLLFLALPGPALALVADYTEFFHWSGQADWDAGVEALTVERFDMFGTPYLAAGNSSSDVVLFDAGGDRPVEVGAVRVIGRPTDIAPDGGYFAYVTTAADRLVKIQVADPAAPTVAWTLQLPVSAQRLSLSDRHAYLACGTDGLLIVDLLAPYSVAATLAGTYHRIEVDGDRALALTDSALVILDLAVPTAPSLVGSYSVVNAADLLSDGPLVHVAVGLDVLHLDVSDPQAPALLARDDLVTGILGGGLWALDRSGDELLALTANSLVTLERPSGPVTWVTGVAAYARDLALAGGSLAVAAGSNGLHFYRDGRHAYPPTHSDFSVLLEAGTAPRGRLLAAGTYYQFHELSVYARELESGLIWAYQPFAANGPVTDIAVDGDRLYIGTRSGQVEILDIAGVPTVLGVFEAEPGNGPVLDLELVSGQLAVLGYPDNLINSTRIRIFDVDDPTAVTLSGSLEGPFPWRMHASDGLLILAQFNVHSGPTVDVVDVADPSDPFLANEIYLADIRSVAVAERRIYAVISDSFWSPGPTLAVVDLTDPAVPFTSGGMPLPSPEPLAVAGNTAYQVYSGVTFDLADPLHPQPSGSVLTGYRQGTTWLLAAGQFLVGGDNVEAWSLPAQGAVVSAAGLDLAPPRGGMGLQAAPNPFNPQVTLSFVMAAAGAAHLEIFDLRGRRVADLGERRFAAGPQRLTWDGTDARGRSLPSGLYLARVRTAAGSGLRKLLLAR